MYIHSVPTTQKRLELEDSFNFSCRKEHTCFGSCCRNRELVLTPYDVMRLKNVLHLHSDDFLTQQTLYRLDPSTGFPVISLKLKEDAQRHCPFLTPEGCSVYDKRPTVCRLFPLARASGFKSKSYDHDEFFYLLPAENCLGMQEPSTLAVKDWLEVQGLNPYREANDRILHLMFHPERPKDRALNEKQLRKIVVALYNLDVFRQFVLNTDFFTIYTVDSHTKLQIETDDFELLSLGFSYLMRSLFP
jgi:uncharacterized protein